MLIAVPSKGRAGVSKTIALLDDAATVYVPAVEADAYRRAYPDVRISPVPMTIRGITPTRNWILDTTDDPHVVMVDDDVKVQGWIELLDERSKHRPLTTEQWLTEWARLFEVTESMGYRVWGVATHSAPRGVYPWRPFLWRSYVTASCMGILNYDGSTRFDPSFVVKEDYELTCRLLKEDGGLVAARYLYWENTHWGGLAGGCVDYRTQAMEADAIRRLQAMYPGMLRRVKRGGSSWSVELVV